MRRWLVCLAACALFALPLPTVAAPIVVSNIVGTFSNTVGGTNIAYFNPGADGYNQVRWGVGTPQSGLGFLAATPPDIDASIDVPFVMGTLRHYNQPIAAGTAASSTQLDITADVAGLGQGPFNFRFLIDETPNVNPCTYGPPDNPNPCPDKITFQNLVTSDTFVIDGVTYTVLLKGFSNDGGGTFVNNLISQEGGSTTAELYGVISTPVPEPASLLLLGSGLAGLARACRRRRR